MHWAVVVQFCLCQLGWFVCGGSQIAGFAAMYMSARAQFSPTGQLVDAGLDLSMTEGMTE